MRDIKFRVWCEFEIDGRLYKEMAGPENWFLLTQTGQVMSHGPMSFNPNVTQDHKVLIVEFWTGHKAKNGVEIYDGDIYKDADGIISVVKMAVDGWALFPVKKTTPVRNLYWHNVCDKTKGEIIGDIHTTPELMGASDA